MLCLKLAITVCHYPTVNRFLTEIIDNKDPAKLLPNHLQKLLKKYSKVLNMIWKY